MKKKTKGSGRPSISKYSELMNRISDDLRYGGLDHLFTLVPNKKRRGEVGCSRSA